MPTFALGFVWHLMLFHIYYERLAMYRKDIIISFGFLSMLIQAFVFAWFYQHAFSQRNGSEASLVSLQRDAPFRSSYFYRLSK